ncbi:MAG: S41 family peptidase [candidate division Zixibacteria bacterium]|nr:S41 family peptidase [candidate division Zixibacteria bacterium]
MTPMRRFILQVIALSIVGVALIWTAGNGVAVQSSNAMANQLYAELNTELSGNLDQLMADTMTIDADENRLKQQTEHQESPETLYKNIKIFNEMAYHIKNRYMEEVDAKKLIRAGIRGMLEDLDPFSVLLEERSYDQLMESTHGKYEGLGMQIDSRGDRIRIVTPIEGSPAYRLGFQAGDVIWKIDTTETLNMTTQDAANLMRGTAGTSVHLKIKREGVPDFLDYDVERAVIELKSVNYYGYFPGTNIGYLRLSRFAEETSHELQAAIDDLKSQKNLEGIVFDLRSNGGGLLHQAVETANLFLDSARTVVFTRGRDIGSERYFSTESSPLFPEGKLVVLVNGGTASASEIVAGAVQDWDRGIIMGQTTYGKGLVQRLFSPGQDQSIALKLTTAKYYIPSGRCIQSPDRDHKRGSEAYRSQTADENVNDSLTELKEKEIFYTDGGRIVYGGGGVVPDVDIESEKWYPIEINLDSKSMFFDFAVKYSVAHPELDESFEVTDKIMTEFKSFLVDKEFDYKTSLEVSLEEMKEIVAEEEKEELFSTSLETLEKLITAEKEADFERSEKYIKRSIKREVLTKLYGQRGLYEGIVLQMDPVVQEALELITNDKDYSSAIAEGIKKAEI